MHTMHFIKVKYIPASNTRGSRIKITSLRFNDSVYIPYDYAYNQALDIALAWLKECLINHSLILGYGEASGDSIIAISVFRSIKDIKAGKL